MERMTLNCHMGFLIAYRLELCSGDGSFQEALQYYRERVIWYFKVHKTGKGDSILPEKVINAYARPSIIVVNPRAWGRDSPRFWDEGSRGVVGLHEILLYPIVYRNMDENTLKSDDFSEIEIFVAVY